MSQPRKNTRNWAPFLLLLPSTVFLTIFFAWPMVRSLVLAFRADDTILTIHAELAADSPAVGQLRQSTQVALLANRGVPVEAPAGAEGEEAGGEGWYRIRGLDPNGQAFEGWVPEGYIREDEPATEGGPVTSGTVRRRDREVRAEPGPISPVTAQVLEGSPVAILDRVRVVIWFQLQGTDDRGQTVAGWASSGFIDIISQSDNGVTGLVKGGDAGEWTLRFIERMVNDRDFMPALQTTILLLVLILPIQFLLAFIMALVLQSRLRGNTWFLYIYSIPLATSDLAVGIVWSSVFTQSGFLNSLLQGLGLIDNPMVFLSNETKHFMILAVVLAEVWRATSIVMVIIVSGLQAVPQDYLEAAELFGAGLWQRVRHVIIPLLKPSLQVALILRTILAFQVFGVVIAIAGRGLTVLANETYRWYVEYSNPNVSAAYAGFILLISMVTAIFYLRSIRTQEEALSGG